MTYADARLPATLIPAEHRPYTLAKEFVRRAAALPLEAQWRVVDEMTRPEYSEGVKRFLIDAQPEALLGGTYYEMIGRVTEIVRAQPYGLAVTLAALYLAAGDLRRMPLPSMAIYAPFAGCIPPAALINPTQLEESSTNGV